MKIALIVDGMVGGGAEKQAVLMAAELQKRGAEVDLIRYHPINDYRELIRAHGVNTSFIGNRGLFRIGRLRALAHHLRVGGFDVVHCVKGNASVWGCLAAKIAGINRVFAGYRIADPVEMPHSWMLRIATYGATGWIVNAESVKEYLVRFVRLAAARIHVVPNGLLVDSYETVLRREEARAKFGLPQDSMIISMIAALRSEKNHEMYLRVVREVARLSDRAVFFLVVGDGPRRQELEAFARKLDVDTFVRFLGRCSDIPGVLRATDIVAHSSIAEGLPNAVMEAGAAGIPVVAVDSGDTKVVIRSGETGYVVGANDDSAMCDRLLELIDTPDLRMAMGEAAREHICTEYSSEAMGDRLLEVYGVGAVS